MPLTDRASVKRAIYRLANLSDEDAALTEHDQGLLEGIHLAIEDGLNDSQEWMLRAGFPDPWLVVGTAVVVQGSDGDPEGRYIDLEDDFLRLLGDENASAFYQPSRRNRKWGRQLSGPREGRGLAGDGYWVEGSRIRLAQRARPPTGLVYDYIRKTLVPQDGENIDFPEIDRPLVAAYAAFHAAQNDYLPGGDEMYAKIARNLRVRRSQAWKRARRTTQARKMRRPDNISGARWLLYND